jgi:hypothetical protein
MNFQVVLSNLAIALSVAEAGHTTSQLHSQSSHINLYQVVQELHQSVENLIYLSQEAKVECHKVAQSIENSISTSGASVQGLQVAQGSQSGHLNKLASCIFTISQSSLSVIITKSPLTVGQVLIGKSL